MAATKTLQRTEMSTTDFLASANITKLQLFAGHAPCAKNLSSQETTLVTAQSLVLAAGQPSPHVLGPHAVGSTQHSPQALLKMPLPQKMMSLSPSCVHANLV